MPDAAPLIPAKRSAVIFYSRLPTSNLIAKTRLADDVSNQTVVSQLARVLIEDMLQEYLPRAEDTYDLIWYYRGDLTAYPQHKEYPITAMVEQLPAGLSMGYIHERVLQHYQRAVIVGSDIPLLPHATLEKALQLLTATDVVIAPMMDSGYGLIGMHTFHDLYSPIQNWDSRTPGYNLMHETLELCRKMHLNVELLPTLFDLDTLTDLQALYNVVMEKGSVKSEYSYLARTMECIHQHASLFGVQP